MNKVLKDAVAEAETLPEAVQEKIGQELHGYVKKLRQLRGDVKKGLQSLNSGDGKRVNINDVIRRARARHGKA